MPAPIIGAAVRGLQVAASNPAIRAKVAEYASKALGKNVDTIPALVNEVKRGVAPAAVAVNALARAGMNPDDMFEGLLNGQMDAATRRIYEDARVAFAAVTQTLDSSSVVRSNGQTAVDLLQREVFYWARARFGANNAAIREAHAKLRMFVEMDAATLERNIALFGSN